MGWRPGRGIGTATATKGCEAAGSKWGTVSGVSLDNTPLYVLLPKVWNDVHPLCEQKNVHGLGLGIPFPPLMTSLLSCAA